MSISSRSYDHEADFFPVRKFIADTFFEKPSYQLWIPSRFENSTFNDQNRTNHVNLWWKDTRIVGVCVVEPPNNIIYIPHKENLHLISEMIQWAEKTLISEGEESEIELYTYSLKNDKYSISELKKLGYEFVNECEHTQIMKKTDSLPEGSLPKGFYIKIIEPNEYDQYVKAIEIIFQHKMFTHEVFEEMRKAKFYKDDLLLGVFTENGTLAGFTQQRIDEFRIIEFEPVGVLPKFRKKGLAKALMRESFIRAEKYDPEIFYVGGAPTEEADRLYKSVGFTDMKIVTRWSKKVQAGNQ